MLNSGPGYGNGKNCDFFFLVSIMLSWLSLVPKDVNVIAVYQLGLTARTRTLSFEFEGYA